MKVGILGGGSWATAIAKILTDNGAKINWWVRSVEQADHIKEHKHNPRYLRSVEFLDGELELYTDLDKFLECTEVIIVATPSAFIHSVLAAKSLSDKKIVSAVKGIIPEYNLIPAHYFSEYHKIPMNDIAIISGPCHAEEVAMEKLSYLTIASEDSALSKLVADKMDGRYIRCSVSEDLVGTEISAVLKNVYALACGIAHGLGYGDNYMAVLVSNAIQEIEQFIDHAYPLHRDVKQSAYLGDLLVTAYSLHSRNRRFGNLLGKGYSLNTVKQEMNMVAEGYYAAACINELAAQHNVELTIANTVYEILYKQVNPRSAFIDLSKKLY
ncbi:NAD(P)H-dependent glycerol-3-phosphate dehydrogenase [Parvicella tangerina]|uniref:Glycerol-3-phosphate dehydrogenase [NAD(P)+] n=1 Tax=Parvicella tangerina TaxID=2829795 RepID=A0A916N8Y5_9FLAO|nr:NAD(P)H-dependent glycerol-3-phosphate dehydrogenase [Parvicella tangerina]CAG5076261.1 Glycerol-3-phosphate dehydrogenase [NAD(P)+] [Parvicella tangerina]